jgi:CRP-like cAMP-binding protein
MADRDLIAENDLFADLDYGLVYRLVALANEQHLQRGDVVFAEEDEASQLYIVTTGRIAISNRSLDGRESMLALMERGDIFGEMSLFDGLTRSSPTSRCATSTRRHRHTSGRWSSCWPSAYD